MEVFLSHTSKDKNISFRIKNMIELTGAKVRILTYEMDPSKTIIEKVKDGIRTCDMGIILWTENSKEKDWVIQEAGALAYTDKPIVVLMDNTVEPPGAMLDGVHYIRMNDQEGLKKLANWIREQTQNQQLWKFLLILGGILLLVWWFSN